MRWLSIELQLKSEFRRFPMSCGGRVSNGDIRIISLVRFLVVDAAPIWVVVLRPPVAGGLRCGPLAFTRVLATFCASEGLPTVVSNKELPIFKYDIPY